MRRVHPYQLALNRRLQSQASFTAMELAARQQSARDKATQARDKLRDVITATGLPAFQGVAILAAADSFAKASTLALSALPSADPVPAPVERNGGEA